MKNKDGNFKCEKCTPEYRIKELEQKIKELEERNETMERILELIRDRQEYLSVDIIFMIDGVLK